MKETVADKGDRNKQNSSPRCRETRDSLNILYLTDISCSYKRRQASPAEVYVHLSTRHAGVHIHPTPKRNYWQTDTNKIRQREAEAAPSQYTLPRLICGVHAPYLRCTCTLSAVCIHLICGVHTFLSTVYIHLNLRCTYT